MARKQLEANEVTAKASENSKLAEKTKEKMAEKKKDAAELQDIEDAALGHTKSSNRKPDHVIEGELAEAYVKHTI